MPTIYLDACCINRPFDDQTQDRVRLEAEAVLLVLAHVERGEWRWIGSEVLASEIGRIPDPERRRRAQVLSRSASDSIALDDAIAERASRLGSLSFGAFDALHLASAEAGGAEVLLTTDDRFVKLARRSSGELRVRVENPLTWLKEGMEA